MQPFRWRSGTIYENGKLRRESLCDLNIGVVEKCHILAVTSIKANYAG